MNNHPEQPADDSCGTGRWPSSRAGLAAVWLALVALAVIGRLWQPSWNGSPLWNATPMAAVALAAGYVFPSALVATSVPVVALLVSDLALPAHDNIPVALVVLAATAWPVILGATGLLGTARPRWFAVLGGSLASSLVFFFSTNVAHWLFASDYPRSAAGLVECLVAALPFYRWMPIGDVAWTVVVFAILVAVRAAVGLDAARPVPQAVRVRPLD
jgi:hypothetical protein